jgi:general secretion pathway protein I
MTRTAPYRQTARSNRGFTLIEVLLALSVFALSFGLILETLGGASRNVRVAGDIGKVALLAQNKLDAVGIDTPIKAGSSSGKLDEVYSYQLDISPYAPEDSTVPKSVPVKLYLVELSVSWGKNAASRTEKFATLRSVQAQPGQN